MVHSPVARRRAPAPFGLFHRIDGSDAVIAVATCIARDPQYDHRFRPTPVSAAGPPETAMNFKPGYQMLVCDPRVMKETYGPPGPEEWWWGKGVRLPEAYKSWVYDAQATVLAILAEIARVAKGAKGGNGLDAVHFLAHGGQGAVHLGKEWLSKPNIQLVNQLANLCRYIVFYTCSLGKPPITAPLIPGASPLGGSPFARAVAQRTFARVVVARQPQSYDVKLVKGFLEVKQNDWIGPVDVYYPDGLVQTYNDLLDSKFDLEKLIFGKK